jgi:hypothetical protein
MRFIAEDWSLIYFWGASFTLEFVDDVSTAAKPLYLIPYAQRVRI